MLNSFIFDIEADGLTPTKIHCVSWHNLATKKSGTITDYPTMRRFFSQDTTFIGHNIIRYDVPVVERLLGVEVKAYLIDTLQLSWYLYPKRIIHGLADWGEEFGVPKPPIDDWENLPLKEYVNRCEEDVKINTKLWLKEEKYLNNLYKGEIGDIISYLMKKLKVVQLQEKEGWNLDVERCERELSVLDAEYVTKYEALSKVMPKVSKFRIMNPPKAPYKQDGNVSAVGERWFAALKQQELPSDWSRAIKIKVGEIVAKPSSHQQIKDWLFSLGWKPITFKFDRSGFEVRKIPQVKKLDEPELCSSVINLIDKESNIKLLEGMSIVKHRSDILRNFLKFQVDGKVHARVSGLTNTLRWKHKELVNLPGVFKPYGKLVRGVLLPPKGELLCGADMSGLEDRLKQHYIFKHDPEYVKQLQEKGYDPHLDICVIAGILSEEQAQDHKDGVVDYTKERHSGKTGNYACQYGATAFSVAANANISMPMAERVVNAYWEKNWAIKEVADEQVVKIISGQKWLLNPVNNFYYSLRADKDRFSTLVQGTGSYCFDEWIFEVIKRVKHIMGQFHDEGVWHTPEEKSLWFEDQIDAAMSAVNSKLKLNVRLDYDVKFGNDYSEVH